MAEAALADGVALADGEAVSTAERALGMAARELDDLPAATAHLRRAIRVARRAEGLGPQIGPGLPVGMIHANLGFVAARRGDVPAALALYDLSERELPTAQVAMALLDRCETLLAVRLVPEARQAAEEAARRLEAAGRKSDLAEARLMVAQAALLDGDGRAAEQAATQARRAFLAQDRLGWATLAGYVALQARWQDGRLGAAQLGRG